LQQEHRFVRQRFAPAWRPEASDRLIAQLASQARQMAAVLRDAPRTTFHWVTLPERLALAESEDAIAASERRGLPAAQLIGARAAQRRVSAPESTRPAPATGRDLATVAGPAGAYAAAAGGRERRRRQDDRSGGACRVPRAVEPRPPPAAVVDRPRPFARRRL